MQDGNVTIRDQQFNPENKKLAIVLINTDKTDYTKGNLLITPQVRYLSANIFTDGSILSVKEDGERFVQSDTERNRALQDQLVFYGNLFSKNTVGGAVKAEDGKYILPSTFSPNTTSSLDEAVKYDLSFLRMNSKNPDTERNRGRPEAVVILLNMDFFQDPLSVLSSRDL